MSKEGLLIALLKSRHSFAEFYQSNFDNAEIEEIRKSFNKLRDRFSVSKLKKNRKKLYRIENNKHVSRLEEEEIRQYLTKLEKSINKFKKYYDHDDLDYKGIRDIENLFDEVNEVDYYKPIKNNNSAFNGNYIEYGSRGDKNEILSPKEYLDMIRPYLRDMINDHRTPMKVKVHSGNKIIDCKNQFGGEWKIQLTMQINFITSKDSEEIPSMSTKSDNIEIMIGNETDDIIEEFCKSLLQSDQEGLKEKIKGSNFVCNSVDLLYYHLHKTSLRRGGSYVDSPEQLKNKNATINPKNNDNCFQYAITAVLNYNNIKK